MLFPLVLIFIFAPLIELYFLIRIGALIGAFTTVFLVVFTGVAGAILAKSQSSMIITKIQNNLSQGQIPTDELIEGLLVFIGGLLLLTPGFITDALGFSFIFPLSRLFWIENIKKYFGYYIQKKHFGFHSRKGKFSNDSKKQKSNFYRKKTKNNNDSDDNYKNNHSNNDNHSDGNEEIIIDVEAKNLNDENK